MGKRNELILNNLGLVRKIAYKYAKSSGYEYDDLFQVGCVGLIRAADRFNTNKNYKFSTFAVSWITGLIKTYLRDHASSINYNRDFSNKAKTISLDAAIEGTNNVTYGDLLEGKQNCEEKAITILIVENYMKPLTERQRKAVLLRLQGRTFDEISKALNISRTSIYNNLRKAYSILRSNIESAEA